MIRPINYGNDKRKEISMKLTVEDILGLSEEEYIMVYDESKEEYFKDKNGYTDLSYYTLLELDLLHREIETIGADDYVVCNIK